MGGAVGAVRGKERKVQQQGKSEAQEKTRRNSGG